MVVKELLTKWGFDIDHKKLETMEHQLESIHKTIEVIAGIEMVKALYELTEKFSEFAEQIHVAAETAGITVEAYQGLAFAAKQSAVSQEELGTSMARLARRLYEARTGSEEAQKAFMNAGFSPGQLQGIKNGEQALMVLSDRMKSMKDPIQKQAIAMELLGRGGYKMTAFLSQGSAAISEKSKEAAELGIVLNEQQVESLVDVEHALQKVWGVIKGVGATLAAHLAPNIEAATKAFIEFYQRNKDFLMINVTDFFDKVAYGIGYMWGVFEGVFQKIKKLLEFLGIDKSLGKIVFEFAKFVSAVMILKKAWVVIAEGEAVFAALNLELLATYAAIAGIVLVVHELYNLFKGGGWEGSWIGDAFKFIGGLGGGQMSEEEKMKGIKDFGAKLQSMSVQMGGIGGVTSGVSQYGPPSPPDFAAPQITNNYSPTVNVESADHHEVGKKAYEGTMEALKAHTDKKNRENYRSLQGTVVK